MNPILRQLQNWYNKECLVYEVELVAESEDLARTGRKIRKLKETFASIGPVEDTLDQILEARLFHAHQHFLDRRAMDLLRGRKDLAAIKEYRLGQLQKTGVLLQRSLDRAQELLPVIKEQLQGMDDGGWLDKTTAQQQKNIQNLHNNQATVHYLQTHDVVSVCSIPYP
ncbi:MAG: hypothetical protein HQL84_06295 [Magnetococcales bacterium]|nr:hypothetical protein [Magnetococcales bacterium]MBF0149642.1 hypothetical protein [Magnetococcales bacterium]MBF0172488.1 hypothetical protein [Magnetococcales bacterium]MBF0349231.1 hypothetical protein [Magnetococcales bacterium]MBF0631785.1 hypothetical protein [Magnetococcales bacterium]